MRTGFMAFAHIARCRLLAALPRFAKLGAAARL
jgi:hypothetical protein